MKTPVMEFEERQDPVFPWTKSFFFSYASEQKNINIALSFTGTGSGCQIDNCNEMALIKSSCLYKTSQVIAHADNLNVMP